MTRPFAGEELAGILREHFPEAVAEVTSDAVFVASEALEDVARFLKEEPLLAFDFLTAVTGVDYLDYFEVIYQLTSLAHNHSAILKIRIADRESPEVPSLVPLWKGADFQEREVYDLMGIRFRGHPNMKRILLWEGFPGHPLRKDFLWLERGKRSW